jgi:hypothetical protein
MDHIGVFVTDQFPGLIRKLWDLFLDNFCPSPLSVLKSIRLFGYIIAGGVILTPLLYTQPILGWDWYYFFNQGNKDFNLYSLTSFYPPFAKIFIPLLTWMPWRTSLAVLSGITLMAVALGTWNAGGRYGSIVLALFTPPVLFLIWNGQPDALTLVGVLTGFIPLILIKPQIAIWSIFRHRKLVYWTGLILLVSFIIWPFWFKSPLQATIYNVPSFGWPLTGWPILVLGILMFIGAGKDPWCLMAAGTLISPYVLSYHLAVLTPAIGESHGYRKIVVWFCAWLVALGTGLGGEWGHLLCFTFPVAIFLCNRSWKDYLSSVGDYLNDLKRVYAWLSSLRLEPGIFNQARKS